MSRRSERLVKKRKQSLSEYVEDLSKFGKKRKIDQGLLNDVTNEVNTCEYGQSSKMARRSSSSQRLNEGNEGCSTKSPVFYLPTRLSTYNNPMRRNPLPNFDWANSGEVWKAMLSKEFVPSLRRDPKMFSRHPGLDERMRSILLDWMIEVCEVYKMHRETFYMAVDYLDRYLSRTNGVKKSQLQLVGVTALFVAAKMEEIYPARLADFSYVTDGACTEDDILQQEIVMLKVLEWDLSPVTAHLWLTTLYQASSSQNWRRLPDRKIEFTDMPQTPQSEFCEVSDSACHIPDLSRCGGEDVTSECQQLSVPVTPSHEQYESNENAPECWTPSSNVCAIHRRSDHSNGCSECFVHTAQFSQQEFIQIVRLLDLCVLDSGWLRFSYGVLATTVLYYCLSAEIAIDISGYQWADLEECVNWMAVHARILKCQERVELKMFSRVAAEDVHNIQTHTVSLDLLDRAETLRQTSLRHHNTENVLSEQKSKSLKLPPTVHAAVQSSASASTTAPVSATVLTPPNSHSRKSKHVVIAVEEDSGYGVE